MGFNFSYSSRIRVDPVVELTSWLLVVDNWKLVNFMFNLSLRFNRFESRQLYMACSLELFRCSVSIETVDQLYICSTKVEVRERPASRASWHLNYKGLIHDTVHTAYLHDSDFQPQPRPAARSSMVEVGGLPTHATTDLFDLFQLNRSSAL